MRLKTLRQPEPPIIECIWLNTNDNIEYIKENGEWVPLHHHHGHCKHHVDHIIIEDNNSSSSPSDLNMNEIKILINDKINKAEAESLFQPKGNYALKSDLDNISLPEMPDMADYVKNEDIKDFVKYVSQNLDNNQKAQARTNIGAGTSNFSGNYNDLTEKPTIPDVSDFVDKSNEQYINAVKHFNKKPCIRKESSNDNSAGIWFDDYLHNHIGSLGVSGTSLTNSFPFFSNNKLGVAEIITDKGDQILIGAKTFRNLDSYQLAVSTETNSRYYDEPSIGFYSKGPETYELVGRIGVKRTAWTQGYPAYWEGVGSDPQRLIIEDERGDSYTPIYIDGYGKTKACKSKRSSIIKWNPNNNSFQIEEGTSWISIKSISDRMIQFTIKDVVSVDQYNSFLRRNSIRMFWAVNSTSVGGVQQFQHETIVDVLETRKIDDDHGNITIGFSNAISYEKGTEDSYFGIIIDEL